jgi:hypothetical protein
VQTDLLFRLGAQPTAFEVMSEAPSTQAVLECVRKVLRPSCVPSCHPAQAAAVSSDPVRWKTSDCPEGLCGVRFCFGNAAMHSRTASKPSRENRRRTRDSARSSCTAAIPRERRKPVR